MNREKKELFNLDESWQEAWNYLAGAHKFQYLAIKKIRETELKFQRRTEPDKLVLQSLELAREIILNLKLEETHSKPIKDNYIEEIYQRKNNKIQSEKESSFITVTQEKKSTEFAEWVSYRYKFLENKGWFGTSFQLEMGIFKTSEELLEEFKKEKGL